MKKLAIGFVLVFGLGMISNAAMAMDNSVKTEISKEKEKKKKRSKKDAKAGCAVSGEKKACCSKGEASEKK